MKIQQNLNPALLTGQNLGGSEYRMFSEFFKEPTLID
jgi:hypothetical protein